MSETAHRILGHDELAEGRVTTVTVGRRTLAVTHHEGRYGCLDNHCPHQGGPLGEGSIEGGHLRCPWHGYDYDPLTGTPPPPFDDAPACYRDNGELGKISKEQRSADLDVWQTRLHNPDFAAFAENCGARGFRVERADQLGGALRDALAHDGPSLVDVVADAALV